MSLLRRQFVSLLANTTTLPMTASRRKLQRGAAGRSVPAHGGLVEAP